MENENDNDHPSRWCSDCGRWIEEPCAHETGPEPEDYTITDTPRGGYNVGVVEGKFLGNFPTYSDAQLAVRADMDANQFWPNVWTISDHGNASLVQLTV
jgi:hypothetical protein